ncbi:MAG: hypothetical protein ABL974_16150 [Prosthecobacter sp.]
MKHVVGKVFENKKGEPVGPAFLPLEETVLPGKEKHRQDKDGTQEQIETAIERGEVEIR